MLDKLKKKYLPLEIWKSKIILENTRKFIINMKINIITL